jgi:hypothetical protein
MKKTNLKHCSSRLYKKLRAYQSKYLKIISKLTWTTTKRTLHRELKMEILMFITPPIYLWFYSRLPVLGRVFSFLFLYTVGNTPWTGNQPVARPHTGQHKHSKRTQISMSQVGPEPTIPGFERAKAVRATVIGLLVSRQG